MAYLKVHTIVVPPGKRRSKIPALVTRHHCHWVGNEQARGVHTCIHTENTPHTAHAAHTTPVRIQHTRYTEVRHSCVHTTHSSHVFIQHIQAMCPYSTYNPCAHATHNSHAHTINTWYAHMHIHCIQYIKNVHVQHYDHLHIQHI